MFDQKQEGPLPATTYDLDEVAMRDVIIERLDELEISIYEFALACELPEATKGQGGARKKKKPKGIPYTSTYRYLNGTSDTMVGNVQRMLRYLGLGLELGRRRDPNLLREGIRDASTKAKEEKKKRAKKLRRKAAKV